MIDQEGIKIHTKFIDEDGEVMLVKLGGYVDQGNAHLLQSTIDNCIRSNSFKLIFDLENLVYISSAGWGVLIGEIKRFREHNGDIKLINMGPAVYEIYRMLEFFHILSEYTSLEEALSSFNSKLKSEKPTQMPRMEKPAPLAPKKTKPAPKREEFTKPKPEEFPEPEVEKKLDIEIENILKENSIIDGSRTAIPEEHIEFVAKAPVNKPDIKMLPLSEKIKHIVGRFPYMGTWKIRKTLRSEEYGKVKVGYFRVKSMLKKLDLDTREKRYRYYRSC